MFWYQPHGLCRATGLSLCLGIPIFLEGATLSEATPQTPVPIAEPSALTVTTPARRALPTPTHEELQKLPPEEREARLRLSRDRKVQPFQEALTPAEREQRRLEIRQRLEKRLEALRKRKSERPLSAEEEKQLRRLEEVHRRFQSPKKGNVEAVVAPLPTKK